MFKTEPSSELGSAGPPTSLGKVPKPEPVKQESPEQKPMKLEDNNPSAFKKCWRCHCEVDLRRRGDYVITRTSPPAIDANGEPQPRWTHTLALCAKCVIRQAACTAISELRLICRDFTQLASDWDHKEIYDARMLGCLYELEQATKDLAPTNFWAIGCENWPALSARTRAAYGMLYPGKEKAGWRGHVLKMVADLNYKAHQNGPQAEVRRTCGTCEGCQGPRLCLFAGDVEGDRPPRAGCGLCKGYVEADPRRRRSDEALRQNPDGRLAQVFPFAAAGPNVRLAS